MGGSIGIKQEEVAPLTVQDTVTVKLLDFMSEHGTFSDSY